MIDHEGILRKAAAEIRAANINGWGNACEGGADRIRALESALRKIVRDGDYTAPEGMKRIAQEALGSELETACEHCKGTGKVGTEPGNVSYQMFTCPVCKGSAVKGDAG